MTTSDKTMHTTDAKTLLLGEQALPMAAMEPAMITASKSIAAATLMGTLGDRVALSAIRMTVAEAALVAAELGRVTLWQTTGEAKTPRRPVFICAHGRS